LLVISKGESAVESTGTGYYNRHITAQEQQIYDHLLYWVDKEPPLRLINRFYALFIDGASYPDPQVVQALSHVVLSKESTAEFRYVLNRCCHILINRWQARSTFQMAIPELIKLFEPLPETVQLTPVRSRPNRRLRELVGLFRETDQYLTLRRLSQVLTEAAETTSDKHPLGSLIRRYPYLYEHCLLSEDSTHEQQRTVRQVQSDMQRKFEVDLSQYVTYRVRQAHMESSLQIGAPQRIIYPVANPTLLDDRELDCAIRQYVGQVDNGRTYRDLASNFLVHSGQSINYRTFKRDLYEYITAAVDPDYGKRKFNQQLYSQLCTILPDSDFQTVDDFLMIRTYSHLLNFLVVDKPQSPNHFVLVDLITNLGPTLTTGLLLKIVLLCRKVKPHLERRFSILFNHYESYTREMVHWLVNALEHLNVALSLNFGAVDLSFIK
jgi:hypothetical protein